MTDGGFRSIESLTTDVVLTARSVRGSEGHKEVLSLLKDYFNDAVALREANRRLREENCHLKIRFNRMKAVIEKARAVERLYPMQDPEMVQLGDALRDLDDEAG